VPPSERKSWESASRAAEQHTESEKTAHTIQRAVCAVGRFRFYYSRDLLLQGSGSHAYLIRRVPPTIYTHPPGNGAVRLNPKLKPL